MPPLHSGFSELCSTGGQSAVSYFLFYTRHFTFLVSNELSPHEIFFIAVPPFDGPLLLRKYLRLKLRYQF